MALQGTLETFSVPEVLRLLSTTKKTGVLTLEGDRGAGNVWLADGRIVSVLSAHEQGDKVEAVLFDLLRFGSGSFVFESGTGPDQVSHDADVEELLAEAEGLLEEWRAIETVVPSLDVQVHLVDELGRADVTVTADQWRSIALIGSGISARRLAARLDLGEFDACSLIRNLVDDGLVEIADAPDVSPEAVPADEPRADEPRADEPLAEEPAVEEPAVEEPAAEENTTEEPVAEEPVVAAPGDFLSQLSSSTPRTLAAERSEPVEAAEPEDQDLNRNMLLKFLSSAKS